MLPLCFLLLSKNVFKISLLLRRASCASPVFGLVLLLRLFKKLIEKVLLSIPCSFYVLVEMVLSAIFVMPGLLVALLILLLTLLLIVSLRL